MSEDDVSLFMEKPRFKNLLNDKRLVLEDNPIALGRRRSSQDSDFRRSVNRSKNGSMDIFGSNFKNLHIPSMPFIK